MYSNFNFINSDILNELDNIDLAYIAAKKNFFQKPTEEESDISENIEYEKFKKDFSVKKSKNKLFKMDKKSLISDLLVYTYRNENGRLDLEKNTILSMPVSFKNVYNLLITNQYVGDMDSILDEIINIISSKKEIPSASALFKSYMETVNFNEIKNSTALLSEILYLCILDYQLVKNTNNFSQKKFREFKLQLINTCMELYSKYTAIKFDGYLDLIRNRDKVIEENKAEINSLKLQIQVNKKEIKVLNKHINDLTKVDYGNQMDMLNKTITQMSNLLNKNITALTKSTTEIGDKQRKLERNLSNIVKDSFHAVIPSLERTLANNLSDVFESKINPLEKEIVSFKGSTNTFECDKNFDNSTGDFVEEIKIKEIEQEQLLNCTSISTVNPITLLGVYKYKKENPYIYFPNGNILPLLDIPESRYIADDSVVLAKAYKEHAEYLTSFSYVVKNYNKQNLLIVEDIDLDNKAVLKDYLNNEYKRIDNINNKYSKNQILIHENSEYRPALQIKEYNTLSYIKSSVERKNHRIYFVTKTIDKLSYLYELKDVYSDETTILPLEKQVEIGSVISLNKNNQLVITLPYSIYTKSSYYTNSKICIIKDITPNYMVLNTINDNETITISTYGIMVRLDEADIIYIDEFNRFIKKEIIVDTISGEKKNPQKNKQEIK